ncbi:hypothetical protein BDV96DRAFT_303980 [Lophiotrema nucula]|uniref:Uncharacterized protein n=1 Tax=Lophiotrema nucula TaxID=690887 RepID=A0A6A5YJZ9_9PLEO|nr:hypothetical protein BDV96DRAFT_303980 [Lophiotrema nucula]
MASTSYPLSPPYSHTHPSSAPSDNEHTYTYGTALRSGNPFLCLPRHIRDKIYTHTLTDFLSSENTFNEVPELRDFTYPDICQVDDLLYNEGCQIVIQNTTFTLVSEQAVFHFMTFLEEFKDGEQIDGYEGELATGEGFENVRSLEFVGLGLWEKGVFASAAKMLIKRCPNLASVSLIVDLEDLVWGSGEVGSEINIEFMTKAYDLEALIGLEQLQAVKLGLEPSMSLQKKLARMESERKKADEQSDRITEGLEGFWGLGQWVQLKCLEQMRTVSVLCPVLDDA